MYEPACKILPMHPQSTRFASWTWNTNYNAVLDNYEKTREWVLSYTMNISSKPLRRLKDQIYIDFVSPARFTCFCPFIESMEIKRDNFDLLKIDLERLFIGWLQNDTYIYAVVNEAIFIPHIKKLASRSTHEICIFGYDAKKRVFHCADFTFIPESIYSFEEVSFEDLFLAFQTAAAEEGVTYTSGSLKEPDFFHMDMAIRPFKFNHNTTFRFDPLLVKIQAQNYVNSTENYLCRQYENERTIFGISVYDEIRRQINRLQNHQVDADFRPYQFLSVHKNYMVERIKYMLEHDFLTDRGDTLNNWESLLKEINKCKNLFLKYTLKQNEGYLAQLSSLLQEIVPWETELMKAFIVDIQI